VTPSQQGTSPRLPLPAGITTIQPTMKFIQAIEASIAT
jgi:hypothetical protein